MLAIEDNNKLRGELDEKQEILANVQKTEDVNGSF